MVVRAAVGDEEGGMRSRMVWCTARLPGKDMSKNRLPLPMGVRQSVEARPSPTRWRGTAIGNRPFLSMDLWRIVEV